MNVLIEIIEIIEANCFSIFLGERSSPMTPPFSGFKWFQVVSSGFKWFQVVSSGFKWFQMVSIGFK
jgi:hypothetical protein